MIQQRSALDGGTSLNDTLQGLWAFKVGSHCACTLPPSTYAQRTSTQCKCLYHLQGWHAIALHDHITYR
jgi:hypothetical protein